MSVVATFESQQLKRDIERFLDEDDFFKHPLYFSKLPRQEVTANLFIKSDLTLAGTPWFEATFDFLGHPLKSLKEWEGQQLKEGTQIQLNDGIPFAVALTAERVALNLMQRASAVATHTKKFVDIAQKYNIKILDTRKTTPGLRNLEKYAVVQGGGFNHRMGQTDLWMIKDNHKKCFGGVKEAMDFFQGLQAFYTPIEVEIHDLKELDTAMKLGVRHMMLDNFSHDQLKAALMVKQLGVTYEISGGVTLENLESYCLKGVDAISVGALTHSAPSVDISFKYEIKK